MILVGLLLYVPVNSYGHDGTVSSPNHTKGAQWLSGRVLHLRPRGCRFEPHRRHCVVVLEQDTFILA